MSFCYSAWWGRWWVEDNPWSKLMSPDDFRDLLCNRNRSRVESGLPHQSPCRECFKRGNATRHAVFFIRMVPVLYECGWWEEFPQPSKGEYFTAHYVCTADECGMPFIPAKWRRQDVSCFIHRMLYTNILLNVS